MILRPRVARLVSERTPPCDVMVRSSRSCCRETGLVCFTPDVWFWSPQVARHPSRSPRQHQVGMKDRDVFHDLRMLHGQLLPPPLRVMQRRRGASVGRTPAPSRLGFPRTLSQPSLGAHASKLPPELRQVSTSCKSSNTAQSCLSFSGHLFDALEHTPAFDHRGTRLHEFSARRIAIVGGGPAGLAAAVALIGCSVCPLQQKGMEGSLPRLAITIFEKRSEPIRRQHVFLDFGRLCDEIVGEVRLDLPRLSSLLATHGARIAPGASIELRVLELCLWQLLEEASCAAYGLVSVRLQRSAFCPSVDLARFDDVVGADGRRSSVRELLASQIPRVRLAQSALQVEFAYNCHLEWQAADTVHVLKAHRYQAWQPVLLYQRLNTHENPDYVELPGFACEAVQAAYKTLTAQGQQPFTTPWRNCAEFLGVFEASPDLQTTLRLALATGVMGFATENPAIIVPVEQTLHRAVKLVLPHRTANAVPSMWLLGDAAVGLPVSKGCNLVYHIAAAGKLAASLLAGKPSEYETFVFEGWHNEVWREGRVPLAGPQPACFGARRAGRFTG